MDLDKHYRLEKDPNCWILRYEKKRTNGDGKIITSKDHWYFPNMKLALKKYVDHSLMPCETVKEVISKIDMLNAKIDTLK